MVVIAAAALIGIVYATKVGKEGLSFILSSVVSVGAVIMTFGAMYPDVLPITYHGKDVAEIVGTSIATAASSEPTLRLMAWIAVAMLPIVLVYQGWTFWVFRRRVTASNIPSEAPPTG
jgi:cytochrome d ubiquinol oxidase subunit II